MLRRSTWTAWWAACSAAYEPCGPDGEDRWCHDASGDTTFTPEVLTADPGRELRWPGRLRRT
ncbi:hypothetical protein ACWDZ6_07195 [Streptomyces sp. NPDC002926]